MRKLQFRLPSPALVVAMVALFSSLGGVSYGLARGSINGREVKNHSLTGKDLKRNSVGGETVKESKLGPVPFSGISAQTAGATHWAAVNSEGVAVHYRGLLNSYKDGENGDYVVIFNKDITSCAYMATIVSAEPVSGALRGQIGVGLAASDHRALQVQTTNAAGAPAKRPFHVAVLC